MQWGQQIASTLIPTWVAMESRINNDALPPNSSLLPVRQALLSYLDERRQALTLLSQAGIRDNAWDFHQGGEMMSRSNEAAARAGRLIAAMQ